MPSRVQGSLFKRVWYAWKSYSLPWRRRIFAGMDLEGNTYWELKDRTGRGRPRRTVHYKNIQRDLVDYKVTPQWHQWLRTTRVDPPSIDELESDILRLTALRHNAALADARWAAKPSLLNAGSHPPPGSPLEPNTRFAGDNGLQGPASQISERGEVRADLGGKGVERKAEAGVNTADRTHGLKELHVEGKVGEAGETDPWKDAERNREGFKHQEWDPNHGSPKLREKEGKEDNKNIV